MTIQLRTNLNIGAWLTRVSCVGLALLITTAVQAQSQNYVVHSDDDYVGQVDDAYVGDLDVSPAFEHFEENYQNEVSQAGCFSKKQSCDGCCDEPCGCCCPPWWAHRTGVFGQFLSLRPGSTDLVYAIEQDSVLANDDPTGPVGRTNIDEENAYRVGFSLAHNYCSSIVATYTNYSGSTSDFIQAANGNVLYSTVIHPSEVNVGDTSGTAAATTGLDFQLLDLACRNNWKKCNNYSVNWSGGFRYGKMDQVFSSQQLMPIATGTTDVSSSLGFNGFGMLLGLDAERCCGHHGLITYGKGIASFLAGNWNGRYRQTSQFGGGVIANEYEDFRITPVVDLELGLAWQSPCGRCRVNLGYVTSAWFDAVSTRQYIDAVRFADYNNVSEDITFSGWTTGLELRF